MKNSFFFLQFLSIILLTGASAFAETTGETAAHPASPADWFIYTVIMLALLGSLVSILLIRSTLANAQWSLAIALSEGVELTERGEDGKPIFNDNNQPILVTTMQPSTSRMVALMGTMAILLMFLSFGSFALFYFAKTGRMPEGIDKAVKFLTAGLTLFAPYLVNKFSKSFELLSPRH
ncbi:MAG: hypothetical protein D3910_05480 [Candidatus Electrothrix sp. ATG2]|nr:hypothetical protein [Candidatus Electrothrix sp. ATG2]